MSWAGAGGTTVKETETSCGQETDFGNKTETTPETHLVGSAASESRASYPATWQSENGAGDVGVLQMSVVAPLLVGLGEGPGRGSPGRVCCGRSREPASRAWRGRKVHSASFSSLFTVDELFWPLKSSELVKRSSHLHPPALSCSTSISVFLPPLRRSLFGCSSSPTSSPTPTPPLSPADAHTSGEQLSLHGTGCGQTAPRFRAARIFLSVQL